MLGKRSIIPSLERPSFWEGVASLYDIFNLRQRNVDFRYYSDYLNIYKDFNDLKFDFDVALSKFDKNVL